MVVFEKVVTSAIAIGDRRSPSRSRIYDLACRRFEEPFEQRTELAGAPEVLGVPLDAEAEARGRILDRFDDAVRRGGRHTKARRRPS